MLEEIHDPGGWFKNYYEALYGWVPYRYKRSNFKATFERMLKAERIEKVVKDGEPCLRISSRGKKKLVRDFPIVLLVGKKWRGIGTLVVFDIEEKERVKRNSLRRWLLRLGAGKVQRSVYIFAYEIVTEIREAVERFGLEEEVEVFPADLRFIENKKRFAAKIWKLKQLEKEYLLILDEIYALRHKEGREMEKGTREIRKKFLEVLVGDPCLPKEFLPDNWIGGRVKNLVKTLPK